jgi:hypothetical protein
MESNLKTHRSFISKTPIELLLNNFLQTQITDYIYHTKAFLINDDSEIFIFILRNYILFTSPFDEEQEVEKDYIISTTSFHQVSF